MTLFQDRADAGRQLAEELLQYANRPEVIVLELPPVGVPVGGSDTCAEFQAETDVTVCAITPDPLHAVGTWYAHFSQTRDDEVCELLEQAG